MRRAGKNDLDAAAALALRLWPGHGKEALRQEFESALSDGAAIFLRREDGGPAGFAQCGLRREYVEGTHSRPAAYLEGIFVEERFRRRGIAGKLLSACEDWAREQGCAEFACDAEWNNAASISFHAKAGFGEANRIVCFVKKL